MVESHLFRLPVVDTGKHPEQGQGVYRENALAIPDGTLSLQVVMLGYLVQCWTRLNHPGYLTPVVGPLTIRDQGEFDFTRYQDTWEVELVTLDIISMPNGIDLQFGAPNLVYVGKGAFFRSALPDTQFDWLVDMNPGAGFGFSGEITLNTPQTWGNQMTTGMIPTTPDTAQHGTWDTGVRPQTWQPLRGSFQFSFQTKPKQKRIQAGVQNNKPYYYPLVWFNHEANAFHTPDIMANGFMWSLKPGVIGSIRLWGRPKDPYVSAGGGEGTSHAAFNPLTGGFI